MRAPTPPRAAVLALGVALAVLAGACTSADPPADSLGSATLDATDATEVTLGSAPHRGAGPALSGALAFRSGPPTVTVTEPGDGAVVPPSFRLAVTATNLQLSPAGETRDGEGHLHVLIDRGCVAPGDSIPFDDTAVHIGDGAASTQLVLAPGRHELCVQVSDGFHIAVAIVDQLTVRVVEQRPGPGSHRWE